MSVFGWLFGAKRPISSPRGPQSAPASTLGGSAGGSRREMLRVALRDTLNRHGIPATWITAEALSSTARNGEQRGIHWRLVVRHWDPRLLNHGIALQHSLIKRVTAFDPMASGWLTGISWQFALPDEAVCPPMPHPGTWTSEPRAERLLAHTETIAQATPEPESAKAHLEQLFSIRDADFKLHNGAQDAAQPQFQKTEPSPL
jgi:hypothetical protein